jgi:quinol-cytochrome oxidoreductase complex cytochrome b subunit
MSWKSVKDWIEYRLPVFSFLEHMAEYKTPKNLSYMWNFGSLLAFTLAIMILSGIFLAMHYVPHADHAFESVERIMRDVNFGWLIRYIHMNGASFFFILVYAHIFRALYYGSYKYPRELIWLFGVVIYVVMMATAFLGYVLPWGQMSYWGATVITNFFSVIPFVGQKIVVWIWGGFSVDNPTLNRFFVLHFLLPFILVALSLIHVIALHKHKSNNPLGIDLHVPSDMIPFHPYFTAKDCVGVGVFMTCFVYVICFQPNFFGEPDNYIPANPLVTPAHIVPEWYFLPFYAILRSIPNKLGGVMVMGAAIVVLAMLPWLDTSPIRSAKFRPYYRIAFWIHLVVCIILGWAGKQPAEGWYLVVGRVSTFYYFFHFIILMPVLGRIEPRPNLPESIGDYMLQRKKKKS